MIKKSSRAYKIISLIVGGVISLVASIAFIIIASRYLNKHDYATLRQTFLVYEFIAPVLLLGLPNALSYFLPKAKNDERGLLLENLAITLCGSLVFIVVINFAIGDLISNRFNNPDLLNTLKWVALYAPFMMLVAGISPVMVFAEKINTLTLYTTLSNIFIIGIGVFFMIRTQSYEEPIISRVVLQGVFCIIGLILMFKAVPGTWRLPKVNSTKEMAKYAVPLGMATMLGSVTLQLHSMIVAAMSTPEEFAVYINGATEVPIVGIITGSITSIIFAEMASECAKGNKYSAYLLFCNAGIKSACIIFPVMCFFGVVAESFIFLMYTEAYKESVLPFKIYLLILPARIVVFGAAMMALGMTREILYRSFFDLLFNAILCIVMIKFFGYLGAIIGLIVTTYFWTIPYNLKKLSDAYCVKFSEIMPWIDLSKILLVSIFSAILLFLIRKNINITSPLSDLLISGFIYFSLTALLLLKLKYFEINEKYRKQVVKIIKIINK